MPIIVPLGAPKTYKEMTFHIEDEGINNEQEPQKSPEEEIDELEIV